MKKSHSLNHNTVSSPINRLTAAALVLPGLALTPVSALANPDDEIDFQYSHYSESERNILGIKIDSATGNHLLVKLPDQYHPIEADSLRGTAKISLSDRVKFSFNYTQDTWSGATPLSTVPAAAAGKAITPILITLALTQL